MLFHHIFRNRSAFYQDHRERHRFELSKPVSQDTAGCGLFSPLAIWFPNGTAEFQTLLFVLSHGSRNQSIIPFRKHTTGKVANNFPINNRPVVNLALFTYLYLVLGDLDGCVLLFEMNKLPAWSDLVFLFGRMLGGRDNHFFSPAWRENFCANQFSAAFSRGLMMTPALLNAASAVPQ